MNSVLIILFTFSLIYLSISERFRTYASLIGLQGVLLFAMSLAGLNHFSLTNVIFIASETLIFKGIVVPILLFRIIQKTEISSVHKSSLSPFYTLLLSILGILISSVLAFSINNKRIDNLYFAISIFSLYTGLLLIITHKRVFSHLIGFLILENTVMLSSLSFSLEMPLLINFAMLLDIIVGVLILGVFIIKIPTRADELTILKD
jgi:hydrogenase-4 component E